MNRREWLGALALAGIPGVLARRARKPAGPERLDHIGLQLYTVRDALARDFPGTLARVADVGYDQVEFAGYFDRSPRQVRSALDAAGLSSPSAHVALESLRNDWARTLEAAHVVGHHYLVVAFIPEDERPTLDGYKTIAELLNRAGAEAHAAGVQLAYHNHDYEFQRFGRQLAYDVLLAETDPSLVQLELDLYWITRGGGDPLVYFARYPGRFPLVHVKDMDGTPAKGMVPVGRGVIDFKRIFARHEVAGIRYYFVEHDNPSDPFASIRVSYDYLRHLEFGGQ